MRCYCPRHPDQEVQMKDNMDFQRNLYYCPRCRFKWKGQYTRRYINKPLVWEGDNA